MRLAPISFVLLWAVLLPLAWAHDPGLSSARLVLAADGIQLCTTFSSADAHWLIPGREGEDPRSFDEERVRSELKNPATPFWRLFVGREEVALSLTTVELAAGNNVIVTQHYSGPTAGTIRFHSDVFDLLPPGHRQHATVIESQDHVVLAKLLSQADPGFDLSLLPKAADAEAKIGSSSPAPSFVAFLRLGIDHIITGYDHLLFLFALLITAQGIRPVLKIITSFTLAHSITLGVSAFGVVSFPSRWIEPLIAATIVFVALQNVTRRNYSGERIGLTFAFGLVHGFGFAAVLQEMGISSLGTSAWRALAGFNLGVELGQVAIAAAVIPVIWYLRSRLRYDRAWAPAVSGLIALAGIYWFIERTGWL